MALAVPPAKIDQVAGCGTWHEWGVSRPDGDLRQNCQHFINKPDFVIQLTYNCIKQGQFLDQLSRCLYLKNDSIALVNYGIHCLLVNLMELYQLCRFYNAEWQIIPERHNDATHKMPCFLVCGSQTYLKWKHRVLRMEDSLVQWGVSLQT
jgi:hypothetical protein